MVKVTNGIETFTIPEGAMAVYKNMGFRKVGENKTTNKEKPVKPVKAEKPKENNKSILEEIEEKPISQWNQEEVKEFAAAKGYDVSEAKSLKQAKAIIKKALEEEEKELVEAE